MTTWIVRFLGVALLVGAPLAWTLSRPSVDIGTPPAQAAAFAATSDQVVEPDRGAPAAVPPAAAETAVDEDVSPSPFTITAPRGAMESALWPVAVNIPAIDVAAPVITVGVGSEGELVIPESVLDVGWYQGSAVPGEPGVALLTSHLDTRSQGRGVFAGLTSLAIGDTIELRDTGGGVTRWRVTAREQHDKTDLPPQLFARSGSALVALVTCGGPFNQQTRSYRDNVIVWAEPAA
jgi:LPXTG-site transpeptidase (sortase) family protein